MEKYKQLEVIGKGSFGEVVKAQNIETGELVAIKTMKQKFATWDECMNLRELKSLRKLVNKNIVKLKEVLRVQNQLSFVFEHVDQDIYKLYENQKKLGQRLSEAQVRSIFYQLAQSLSYMHKHGYFHRDLKPENILYSNKDGLVKLIDFGLAREIRSRPPYTDYVATRWYRAPELILRATNYNSPVDIFALGCIMAELYMFKPLFNGSSELDQLQKLTSVLGTPSKLDWAEVYHMNMKYVLKKKQQLLVYLILNNPFFKLASLRGMTFPTYPAIPLSQVISDCPMEAVQLIGECLKWDPQKRPTASKILQHPYFKGVESVLPPGYFNDLEDSKNAVPQNVPSSGSSQTHIHGNETNINFGNNNEGNIQRRNSNNYGANINVLGNIDNSALVGINPLVKKMGNQFSQSDVSITNKLKGLQNFPLPDYKSTKTLELDAIAEMSNNLLENNQQSKPPLNPNRVSRQNQRNQNNVLKNQENTTPSFQERAKGKDSGFNYGEFTSFGNQHNGDAHRQQNNISASKQQRAASLQQNNNDLFFSGMSANNNNNTQQTSPNSNELINGIQKINENANSNKNSGGIYDFANVNINNRNQSQNNYVPTINNTQSKQNINNKTDQKEWDFEQNDILGTYLPSSINSGAPSIQSKNGNHGYSNTQSNPRQLQQVSSAVEKRSTNLPYNTINQPNSNNQNSSNNPTSIHSGFGGIYQSSIETGTRPARNLNSAAYVENKNNSFANGDYNAQSVNSNYRDFLNQNNTNNQVKNFYGSSPNHFNDVKGPSSYVPSALGSNSNPNNYNYGNSNNMYNFSAANSSNNSGGYSLPGASYGIKSTQSSITTNANTLTNKNIYDFNHVRQPVRNLGLPVPQYDRKY